MDYSIKLTEEQANKILGALSKLPFCEVAALVFEIQTQARVQEAQEGQVQEQAKELVVQEGEKK